MKNCNCRHTFFSGVELLPNFLVLAGVLCFEQSFSQQGLHTRDCPTSRLLRSSWRWLPGHVSICCLHAASIMRLILVALPSVNRLTQQSASSLLLIVLTHPTRPSARLHHHLLDLFLAYHSLSWLPLAPSSNALLITFLRSMIPQSRPAWNER